MTDERLGELGPLAKRAAAELTDRIGGMVPRSGSDPAGLAP